MNPENKNICPIHTTHSRLNHALAIFDDINKSYQNPKKFTSDLNNLIQALRNVTFMLQSEKEKIGNFDAWYESIRDVMRKDVAMKWLHDSRTHVVHKGDLEKDSYLSLSIVNHDRKEIFTEKYDPFISTEDAAQSFLKVTKIKFPETLKDEFVIEAERKWVVADFPNAELVDVLIYCFSRLVDVVEAAHQLSGCSVLTCELNNFLLSDEDFMVVLRNNLKKSRISKISTDGAEVVAHQSSLSIEELFGGKNIEVVGEKLAKKYGNISEIKKLAEPTAEDLPFCFMNFHLEMSKRYILCDGYLETICFLYFSKEQPPRMIALQPHNPTSRFGMAESIAEMVEETHCKALIFISEVWIGDLPKEGEDYVPARLQENRREAISVLAATPNRLSEYQLPFHRNEKGEIILDEQERRENGAWPFLNKVREVWEYQKDI